MSVIFEILLFDFVVVCDVQMWLCGDELSGGYVLGVFSVLFFYFFFSWICIFYLVWIVVLEFICFCLFNDIDIVMLDLNLDFYFIYFFMDEFKFEDVVFCFLFIRCFFIIVFVFGFFCMCEEFIFFIQYQFDDEDEVLLVFVEEFGNFVEYVGGKEYVYVILGFLENLIVVEEILVREKVCLGVFLMLIVLN